MQLVNIARERRLGHMESAQRQLATQLILAGDRCMAENVADCGVIGRPDPRWDEVAVACIIRRPHANIDAEALQAHVAKQLARFKVPREIIFVDDLPRTALGKVQHFRLKQLYAAALAQGETL